LGCILSDVSQTPLVTLFASQSLELVIWFEEYRAQLQLKESGKKLDIFFPERKLSSGLPDFSWYNIPKLGKIYQMTAK
jgi:hypothetical protein